jgi:hypothetical protein
MTNVITNAFSSTNNAYVAFERGGVSSAWFLVGLLLVVLTILGSWWYFNKKI